ncbi:MAG: DUF5719 family protein [Tetrasphaera sp.]
MTAGTLQAAIRGLTVAGACAALVGLSATTDRAVTLGATRPGPAAARVALDTNALACPGPELAGVPGVADIATRPLAVADSAPATVSRAEGVRPAGGPRLDLGPLGDPEEGAGQEDAAQVGGAQRDGASSDAATGDVAWRARGDQALLATASGSRAPGLIAAQESAISDTASARVGIRGLIGAACADPSADAWLIAGGGDTGRQERLILVNPGANPAVVDLALHGRGGAIEAPAGRGVSVPAHGRTSVLLDGLARQESAPAVHVTSRAGLVVATLVDTWVEGVTSRGADATGPTAPAALRNVIPAVSGPGPARVRIVATSGKDTIAQVRLLTRTGRRPLPDGAGVQRVVGEASADVRLPELAKDVVAIEVTSDQPAIAAAMTTREDDDGTTDFAWMPAAPPLPTAGGTTLPVRGPSSPDTERTLCLVATGGRAEADVTLVAPDGSTETQRIAVKPDTSTTLTLGSATAVWVRRANGGGALRAAVLTTTDLPAGGSRRAPALTSRPLVPARFAARELPVRQDRP